MEKNSFLKIECPLIKVKEIIDLKNHHFATITEIINSNKKHQRMVKFMDESCIKNRFYLCCLKVSPYKIIINYSRKKSNFTVEKTEDTSLLK